MDNERYRERVRKVLGGLNFDYVEPRFRQYLLADYTIGPDSRLKFFISCTFISDQVAFRPDRKELLYTTKQAKLLGRVPCIVLGKDWKEFFIILPEPDYHSIFGNYPLLSIEDYKASDKLSPRLFWKKLRSMIGDKRKRGRVWLGKLVGIRIRLGKHTAFMFMLKDFVKHLEYSSPQQD